MKKVLISVAMGLYMAVAAGSVFASSHEGRDERRTTQSDQYETKFYGKIQSLPAGIDGIWNVNGREINVTRSTRIKEKYGKAIVGAFVEVEGITNGNTLNANKIEVKRDIRDVHSIRGKIERLSTDNNGTWIVNGQEILVSKDTLIREKHGRAIVGAYVEVEGSFSGNVFSARKIEVKRTRR